MSTDVNKPERSLSKDLAVDVLAAFGAGVSVAPFISLIDMVSSNRCMSAAFG